MIGFVCIFTSLFVAKVRSEDCKVNYSERLIWSGTKICDLVEVDGVLIIESGTHLTADRILVNKGGTFLVGTEENPATNVRITLLQDDCTYVPRPYEHYDSCLDKGTFESRGITKIYGQPKEAWALLTKDCSFCSTITVDRCDGWKVGDEITIAPTGGLDMSYGSRKGDKYVASEAIIRNVQRLNSGECNIELTEAVSYEHKGSQHPDGDLMIQAEVMNLSRDVQITTPHVFKYNTRPTQNANMVWTNYDGSEQDLWGFQGITTRQAFGGQMIMQYTRIDNCGRPYLGYYCLHFHYVGVCPDCVFKGNAITDSNNKAISVHETHQTLVDSNVVFRHRGAFLYLEDGVERDNIISNNVLGCPQLNNPKNPQRNNLNNQRLLPCTLWGVDKHTDADQLEQGGIYQNAFNNHILGNRVYNMQNAHLIYNTFSKGTGGAEGKICKNQMPYGRWKDNVFHHCQGFGWYSHTVNAAQVKQDENGFVTDFASCLDYDLETGEDLAMVHIVEDHTEYCITEFGPGSYTFSTISFKNLKSANNGLAFYFKNFRRAKNAPPFCEGCLFIDNGNFELPGGTGHMEFADCTFIKSSTITTQNSAGHSDAATWGAMSAINIDFSSSTFDSPPRFINRLYQSSDYYKKSDGLIFYDRKIWFDREMSNPTFDFSACDTHDTWVACPESMQIRTVKIWSPNRGTLSVTSTSTRNVPYRNLPRVQWYGGLYSCGSGLAAGPFPDCPLYSTPTGYTFLVAGMSVQIHVPTYNGPMADLFTLEYSETHLPVTQISLTITGDNRLSFSNCVVSSSHDRRFTSHFGAMFPDSGAAWDCKNGWALSHSKNEFLQAFISTYPSSGERYATCVAEDCDPRYSVYDPLCWNGGSDVPGCNHLGRCCRTCNLKGYRKCEDRDTVYNGERITVDPRDVGIAWEVLSKPQVCHAENCGSGWQYQYKCLMEQGRPGGCYSRGTPEKECCQICNQRNLPDCGTGNPPVHIPNPPAGGWQPWQGGSAVPSIPAGSRYIPRSPDSPIINRPSSSSSSTSTTAPSSTAMTSTSTTTTPSSITGSNPREPVLGCRTSCEGVLMDNGQDACSYAKRHCGNQLVDTNLGGATVPACFGLDSDTCQRWNKVGCDLSQCGTIPAPTTTSTSSVEATTTTTSSAVNDSGNDNDLTNTATNSPTLDPTHEPSQEPTRTAGAQSTPAVEGELDANSRSIHLATVLSFLVGALLF